MRHPLQRSASALVGLVLAFALPALAQDISKPAVPLEPISRILEAFKTHQIVALGEGTGHGDEQASAFRLALIRDRRFTAA